MSPYDTIVQKYLDKPQEAPFGEYLEWHLRNGFVFNTPEYFIMGKNCRRLAPPHEVADCEHVFDAQDSDCWYIFAMSGNMTKAFNSMPFPLPWIAFERIIDNKRELRFYKTEDLQRLAQFLTN